MTDLAGGDRHANTDDWRHAGDMSNAEASGDISRQSGHILAKGGKVEKVQMNAIDKTRKKIVEVLDISREEPKTEVERIIQQKLLEKKRSSQGMLKNDADISVIKDEGIDQSQSENDILNEFRGVTMDEDSPGRRSDHTDEFHQNSQLHRNHETSPDDDEKNYNDDYEPEEDEPDNPMMNIWKGPVSDQRGIRLC